jgi:hypothetical protein
MADYYSVIANAISRSRRKSNEARCAIYERARTALRQALRDYEPSLLANEQVALEAAVCRVEADLVLREAS